MSKPRVLEANRAQLEMLPSDLDSRLPEFHPVRQVWEFLGDLDLAAFYAPIKARGSDPGRPAIDPRILICLLVWAAADGVGSARRIERLCDESDVYRWIRGGVSVNHHSISDFRVAHGKALDELLSQILAMLMRGGLIELKRLAQDGTRIRASAAAASFHRGKSVNKCLKYARRQIERLKKQPEEPDPKEPRRQKAAAARAARERLKRLEEARRELNRIQSKKPRGEQKNARVSTSDPEARVMKMGDGGFRPAYNVQLASDTASGIVVGVQVTNQGTDSGLIDPMLDEVKRRTDRQPEEHLVDAGYTKLATIDKAAERGVTVYAPVPKSRNPSIDENVPKPNDSEAVAEWRTRMATDEAKAIYKERAATAELVNADLRCRRGLNGFQVRGIKKVECVVLWTVIAYNILRWISLTGGVTA